MLTRQGLSAGAGIACAGVGFSWSVRAASADGSRADAIWRRMFEAKAASREICAAWRSVGKCSTLRMLSGNPDYDPAYSGLSLEQSCLIVPGFGMSAVPDRSSSDAFHVADVSARDSTIAQTIGDLLIVVLPHSGVKVTTVWGSSDNYSLYNRRSNELRRRF